MSVCVFVLTVVCFIICYIVLYWPIIDIISTLVSSLCVLFFSLSFFSSIPPCSRTALVQYADLDEFLSENNIPDGLPGSHLAHSTGLSGHRSDTLGHSTGLLGLGHITTKRERSPSPSDCVSPDTINPPSPAESSKCGVA